MLDIEDNLFFRMNTEEVASLLEDLETNGDIVMGLPDINKLSDGDSDKSDEEAEGTTKRLSRFLLSAPAHIEQDEDNEDEKDEIIPTESKKKRKRRWVHENRETPSIQPCITTPLSKEALLAESPQEFFELFFDENLFTEIAIQTNLYASQKNKKLEVTVNELKVFIGGMLLSAICPLPNKKKYWASEDHVPKLLSNSMRRDRFLDIMHHLHFQDNTISTEDRAAKLRPLMDNLQRKFIKHGGFPEYLAIEESMIPYFGKHFAKQFIRGKPIKFGYKMWALCSNGGYLHSFDLYMGKKENEAIDTVPNIGLGGNVVLNLIAKANLPSNHNHVLLFDNYFTSISLMGN